MYIARELEKKYTKDEILEFYLNNIYFGNGYYGIQSASRGYFNRDVQDLDLSEQAFCVRYQIIRRSMIHLRISRTHTREETVF